MPCKAICASGLSAPPTPQASKNTSKYEETHTLSRAIKTESGPTQKQETDENCLTAEHHQGRIVATIIETCKLSRPFPIISIKVSFNYVYNMWLLFRPDFNGRRDQ